jgi:hypothetical protein
MLLTPQASRDLRPIEMGNFDFLQLFKPGKFLLKKEINFSSAEMLNENNFKTLM